MKVEVPASSIPTHNGDVARETGDMGESIVWDLLAGNGFDVAPCPTRQFDILAEKGGTTYGIEVKTLISKRSRARMTKDDKNRKHYFMRKHNVKALTVVLEPIKRDGDTVVLNIGYRMGLKIVRLPYVNDFGQFLRGGL